MLGLITSSLNFLLMHPSKAQRQGETGNGPKIDDEMSNDEWGEITVIVDPNCFECRHVCFIYQIELSIGKEPNDCHFMTCDYNYFSSSPTSLFTPVELTYDVVWAIKERKCILDNTISYVCNNKPL